MLDNLPIPKSTKDSLTYDEQVDIIDAVQAMPGAWFVDIDESPYGDSYACLIPPWSDGLMSAFLIERQSEVVVLTDRLSNEVRDIVTTCSSVAEAMAVVVATVAGTAVSRPAAMRKTS